MPKICERCGATSPSPGANAYALFDFCGECSRDLCDECMANGCCGHVPAVSGSERDFVEDGRLPIERG